jgi:hypothetical protein
LNASLDEMLDALARAPADADLDRLDAGTWVRIDRVRLARKHQAWLMPARAGAVVLALSLGAALGAAHARDGAARPDVTAFEVASAFAPSTLLDHP